MMPVQTPRRLTRSYLVASALTILFAVLATSVGLFVPGCYRDAEVLLPQLYGQALLTPVVAVPTLTGALYYAHHQSLRGYVVWLGVSGYLLYTYASYAFLTVFNELYLRSPESLRPRTHESIRTRHPSQFLQKQNTR